MVLSHDEIQFLINEGVIWHTLTGAVNATSLDIHLGKRILREKRPDHDHRVVDYSAREPVTYEEIILGTDGWVMEPGDFILASSFEVFNLPLDISAEYKLKSSMARIGLEHMNAGWCDAGWHGSVLTLELKNMCNHHAVRIRPGDPIGQMVFYRHRPVAHNVSYASRGRYNGDKTVSGIKK